MVVAEQTYRFTVDDYYRMGEVGILPPDVRVELVDGEIKQMPPIHPPHASIVHRLNAVLARKLHGKVVVGIQSPIRLDDFNEPQPDVTVLRFQDDYYGSHHPTPADVMLAIEVADTSLRYDRDEKMPRYGAAGIPGSVAGGRASWDDHGLHGASGRWIRSRASRDSWTGDRVLGRGRPALAGR